MQRKVVAGSNKATNPPPPLHLCGHCKQPAQRGKSLLVFSSCHEGWYCSPEHQVAAWNSHKVLCKQRKKEIKKEKERKESDAAINYLLLNPPTAALPSAAELIESLWNACMEGEVGRARQILLSGVDVNGQSQGATPAYIACQNGHVKILHLLIQHGADLSLADTYGRSPAHIASMCGRVKNLALIMRVNADLINQRDNRGRTPLLYARQFGHDDAVEWLIEHGAEEAGEPLEGAELELYKVLSQLIQMHSIISRKALYLSHIICSIYCRVQSRRTRKRLD